MIGRGDVLVDNFRTGTLESWGFDYPTLQSIRPGLIVCSITGYGQTGPYRERPGYDFMVQAMGGLMSLTGPADGEPFRAGIAIADLGAGMFAASAILAALFARERTGEGQRIDISLLDTQVALLSYVASNYLVSGQLPTRFGNGHPNLVPYQSFRAQDGYFAFASGNDSQWKRFCEQVGKVEWAEDARFATNRARVENRAAVVERLNELFGTRPAQAWIDLCESIGIPAAPINSVDRVFADPQVAARGMRTEVDHPTAGRVPMIGSPLCIPTCACACLPCAAHPRAAHRGGAGRAAGLHRGRGERLAPGRRRLVRLRARFGHSSGPVRGIAAWVGSLETIRRRMELQPSLAAVACSWSRGARSVE